MKELLTSIYQLKFLRNILIAFLAIAILLPSYERLRAFPPFRDLVTHAAEDQANRIALHLMSYDFFKESPLDSAESIPGLWIEEVFMVLEHLRLEKVKIFSKSGEVIFSTDSKDIGKINNNDYFHSVIASGKIFTKVVDKNSTSMEGVVLHKSVVETYIPIMRNGVFVGSVEIYYDIGSQRAAMDALLGKLSLDMVLMGIGLSLLALALVSRAAKEIRGREMVQEALRFSEEKFRCINNSAQDAIIMVDSRGKITLWNAAAEKMFGYNTLEAVGSDMHHLLAPERFWNSANKGFSAFSTTGQGPMVVRKTSELVALHKNGYEFPIEISVSAAQFHHTWHAIGILRDITARKKAEQKLKLGFQIMENAADGILVTDSHGIVEMVNPAFTHITGFTKEEAIGANPSILKSGRHDKIFYQEMWRSLLEKGLWRGEIWNRRKDGAIYPQQLSISAIYDSNKNASNYVAVFNDITQRKINEENLERLAFYDPLTGIPNRMLFLERLDRAIREDRRYKTASALLFLDLDGFKQVNDTYGHETGDLLLQNVAIRLQALVRDEDTVSRLGGDEFTLILRRVAIPQDSRKVAKNVVESMAKPFLINGFECQIGASIGIAFHPLHAEDVETLVKQADMAMYCAKKAGRNRFHIHESVEH